MRIARFVQEVVAAPYYRRRPLEIARFAYAKWLLSRFRLHDPVAFLASLEIDTKTAMAGFQEWLPRFQDMVSKVWHHQSQQGGVSIEDGTMLYGLTRALRPDYVIETGVAAGVSTAFISAALIENATGHLYSIELPPEETSSRTHLDGASLNWAASGVGWAIPKTIREAICDRHTLVLQDVRVALPTLLKQLPYVDIFFHDDLHTPDHMLWEFDLVWPYLRSGGVLVADDVNFGWVQFCRQHRFSQQALNNMQRLSAVRKTQIDC